jgi:hypothetical protein
VLLILARAQHHFANSISLGRQVLFSHGQWSVHAQDHKPSFARDGLQPIVLFARRRFRREIDVEWWVSSGEA